MLNFASFDMVCCREGMLDGATKKVSLRLRELDSGVRAFEKNFDSGYIQKRIMHIVTYIIGICERSSSRL